MKKCYICDNTSENSTKVFVGVPLNLEVRKKWWQAAGYESKKLHAKASLYCCEDHFNVPDDFENWGYMKFCGGRFYLKKGILPKIRKESENEPESIHLPHLDVDEADNMDVKTEEFDEPEYWLPEENSLPESYEMTENSECDIDLGKKVEEDLDVKHDIDYYQQFLNTSTSWDTNFTQSSENVDIYNINSIKKEKDIVNNTNVTSTIVKAEDSAQWSPFNEYDINQTEKVDFIEEKEKFPDDNSCQIKLDAEEKYSIGLGNQEENCDNNISGEEYKEALEGEGSTQRIGEIPEESQPSKKYKCKQCTFSTDRKYTLNFHTNSVHKNVKIFKCESCEYTASTKQIIRRHNEAVHLKKKKFNCDFCEYTASRKYLIDAHIKAVHLKLKAYQCESCEHTASTKQLIKRHIETVHLNVKKYQCGSCDYSTYSKHNIIAHSAAVHLKVKKYKCESCEYSTFTKQRIHKHIAAVHLKPKKFKASKKGSAERGSD